METRARDVSERKRIDDDCNDVEMTERMMYDENECFHDDNDVHG